MGLSKDCELLFKSKNLYEVLAVERNATVTELKKAYKKISLLCHPDKVEESKKEEATRKFQVLSKVHFILSDADKRAFYDETGNIDDDDSVLVDDTDANFWSCYFQTLFPKLTLKAIDDYMKKYTGSETEKDDLIANYLKYEGDMDLISEAFIGYKVEEEESLCKFLKDLIQKKEVPAFSKFVNETKAKKAARRRRQNKLKKEAAEAEEMVVNKKLKRSDDLGADSLLKAMAMRPEQRERQFNELISRLETKYCKKEMTPRKRKRKLSGDGGPNFSSNNVAYSRLKKEVRNNDTMAASDSFASIMVDRTKERGQQFNDLIARLEEKYLKNLTGRQKRTMDFYLTKK